MCAGAEAIETGDADVAETSAFAFGDEALQIYAAAVVDEFYGRIETQFDLLVGGKQ